MVEKKELTRQIRNLSRRRDRIWAKFYSLILRNPDYRDHLAREAIRMEEEIKALLEKRNALKK